MSRVRQFQTAAARRRKDPLIWEIDGKTIRLVSSLELADLAELIEALQEDGEEGENSIRLAAKKRLLLLEIMSKFLEPESKPLFDELSPDLDIHLLNEMVVDLINEFSGAANPTKPSSSSAGSERDGESSTDGVPQEELTL